jgi:hypothetical protein
MGANLVALYDYNRVITSGSSDHQPLQRFVGHTDVVTAVAAGDDVFKECFLSGGCVLTEALLLLLGVDRDAAAAAGRTGTGSNSPAGGVWNGGMRQGCVQCE